MVAGDDNDPAPVSRKKATCEMIQEFAGDAILFAHHVVPSGVTNGRALNHGTSLGRASCIGLRAPVSHLKQNGSQL